jgi:hypothetical protein
LKEFAIKFLQTQKSNKKDARLAILTDKEKG